MPLMKYLILRCLAKRGLEGRTILVQPHLANSFTGSQLLPSSSSRYQTVGTP